MDLPDDRMALDILSREELTPDIAEFTLARADGSALPVFTPGAHITVETPGGAMRRYSLLNDGEAPTSYVIAVKREAASRGGSASMHDDAEVGTTLSVEPPENDFELVSASQVPADRRRHRHHADPGHGAPACRRWQAVQADLLHEIARGDGLSRRVQGVSRGRPASRHGRAGSASTTSGTISRNPARSMSIAAAPPP